MSIVSNTSPITNLAAGGQLSLLKQLYDQIVIPQAVYQELVRGGQTIPGAIEVQTLDWIQTRTVTNIAFLSLLKGQLHEGESEAIALAIELKAEWLLIDEQLGRQVAAEQHLRFTGILGILIEVKRKGLIASVKPILDNLIVTAEFWVSPLLHKRVLQTVEEF